MSNERFLVTAGKLSRGPEEYDSKIVCLEMKAGAKDWAKILPTTLHHRDLILKFTRQRAIKLVPGEVLSFETQPFRRYVLVLLDQSWDTFPLLENAKELAKALKTQNAKDVLLDLSALNPERTLKYADCFLAALGAAEFQAPKYQAQDPLKASKAPSKKAAPGESAVGDKERVFSARVEFKVAAKTLVHPLQDIVEAAVLESAAANRVRYLCMQAGNDLNPKQYIDLIKKEAKAAGLGFELFDVPRLQKLGAGAFLAVCQGSEPQDAGIVKLTYSPSKIPKGKATAKHLTLVGKGVTFDTGGTNLKPASSMYGMHRDMAGSALALALILLASQQQWPFEVSAFLAISDNATGPKAYRPNDVVRSLSGKTIEIVHTDAEGRMLLADTLYLASQAKPDLLIDFATLTGACVAAISSSYSGAFTNRDEWHPTIIQSGRQSGERVWPFPMDEDFGRCLKSDTADTKQCRLTGGVDHIEAAYFLKTFLAHDVPWLHLDLSAADNIGGLGHVDTEVTGFGLRFTTRFIKRLWPEFKM